MKKYDDKLTKYIVKKYYDKLTKYIVKKYDDKLTKYIVKKYDDKLTKYICIMNLRRLKYEFLLHKGRKRGEGHNQPEITIVYKDLAQNVAEWQMNDIAILLLFICQWVKIEERLFFIKSNVREMSMLIYQNVIQTCLFFNQKFSL